MDYNNFAGRLKNTNLTVQRMNISYPQIDTRCWTAIINKGTDNIFVTYNVNRNDIGTQYFDILSSDKTLANVEYEDIFDTIDLITTKNPLLIDQPQQQISEEDV
jgi:hypothetical protein